VAVGAFDPLSFQNDAFQTTPEVDATESISTADTAHSGKDLLRSASEAIATSESAAAVAPVTAFQADSFQNDAFQIITSGSINRTASESISTTDSAVRTASLHRSAADAPTTSDAAVADMHKRNATESISTADAATRNIAYARSASESISTADVATIPSTHSRFIVVIIG
jgi:hypothetical protein